MEENPNITKGNSHSDARGILVFNNDYNAAEVKRIYFIENATIDFVRGWQGHQIEQRWFSAVQGSFKICTRAIDNWENPSKKLSFESFTLSAATFDVLHVPKGYITNIQSLEENSRLMAMSDYSLGVVSDEYRFDINYFNN
ncbi:WxcM-like domain-containing protein [Flavobacterium sp. GP15]|uniref:WxcM-like domain-containing protein n=1 Tax=Flavobacterium sp. GP15 TaxID=2758567 RepID=UPI00165DF32B|nr:WxcM-like domain-containing protein [Flavobacterium sp. GP15]